MPNTNKNFFGCSAHAPAPVHQASRGRTFSNFLVNSLQSLSAIQNAIRCGEDIHMTDRNGSNLLHIAAFHSPADVIQFLVNEGLDINMVDDTGLTPLHFACLCGSLEQVRSLIDLGANYDVRDRKGRCLLFFSIFNQCQPTEVVDYMLNQCHFSVDERDYNGMTPLMMIVSGMPFYQALELTEFIH